MFLKTPRMMNEAAAADAGGAAAGVVEAGAPAAAPAPAAPTGTVMDRGASAAPAGTEPPAWSAPDKYLVKTESGEIDWQATARKIDDGRSHLEKRMGAGDVPPADVSGYKVEAPADYAEVLKDWKPAEDAKLSEFLADAHKVGFTQQQVDLVIKQYGRLMSDAMGAQLSPEQQAEKAATDAAAALSEVWPDEAEFNKNVGLSFQAGQKLAAKLGVPFDEFNAALGNNPMFLRLAAKLAPEMVEDTPQGTQATAADSLDWDAKKAELTAQRDALPEKDPRRAVIVKQIAEHYAKRYPG